MASNAKLNREDLWSLEDYAENRAMFRAQVIEHKKHRQVRLGEHATLYFEDALFQGTQWAAFEPNDEALWSALRLTATTFLAGMAKQGAFYDYKVTCDATTTTQTDIDLGVVNLIVQIAPVKPAEFVVIQIQQLAGAQPG